MTIPKAVPKDAGVSQAVWDGLGISTKKAIIKGDIIPSVDFVTYSTLSPEAQARVVTVTPTKVSSEVYKALGPGTKKAGVAQESKGTIQQIHEVAESFVPFSQFYLPGQLEGYKKQGALGYTKLAAFTLMDLSIVSSLAGGISKLATSALLKTTGGKVAALGGTDSLKTLITAADKKVADVTVEVATKQAQVRAANKALQEAIVKKSVDTGLRQEAVTLARRDLGAAIAEHDARVAVAKSNLNQLQDLAAKAAANPARTAREIRAFQASQKTAKISANMGPLTFKAYGVMQAGITAKEWNKLSSTQKAMGLGMSAIALNVPEAVLGKIKSGAEVAFSPGRIPHRSISVPETYLPPGASMPKTSVRGLTKKEQLTAMNVSADAM
jgi:hypothetical protein